MASPDGGSWGLSRLRWEGPRSGESKGKLAETGRGDAAYSSTSTLTFNLGPCTHQGMLRQPAKTSTPSTSNSENDAFNVILSPCLFPFMRPSSKDLNTVRASVSGSLQPTGAGGDQALLSQGPPAGVAVRPRPGEGQSSAHTGVCLSVCVACPVGKP